ncbi:MAG: PQQ-binding-like beta-propeller repeat protein, partial [Maioricimonas sp. JB049]
VLFRSVAFLNHAKVHATALSLDGDVLWQTTLGPFASQFGYAPSPAIWGPLVLFAADHREGGFLAGVHRLNGEIIWRKKRPAVATYSSPVVAELDGRPQLVISGGEQIASYAPATGESLWTVAGATEATCGTPVFDGDLVFASGGYPGSETICVRADGSGVVWKNRQKCYEQSMLAHDGFLYAVNDNGIAYCWDAATGKEQWKSRLSGPFSASPVLAGGNIYVSNERGTTYVFRADPAAFDLVAENQLGDTTFSTLSVCGGQIFHRVGADDSETLYCIGDTEARQVSLNNGATRRKRRRHP